MYVLICKDWPDALALRMSVREAHLAFARGLRPGLVRLGGPFLDAAGQMCGSLIILDTDDRAEVDAYLAADPYTASGLFESVDVQPWRVTMPWT
ncbi:MAG TPA: YciI family protein [Caulobacteraceae bacterium]|jgi:hypothetical protein